MVGNLTTNCKTDLMFEEGETLNKASLSEKVI